MVRLPLEQFPDPLELPVTQAERTVQRLFGNLRQRASVSPASDGTVAWCAVRKPWLARAGEGRE
jgi:hypothetical protein